MAPPEATTLQVGAVVFLATLVRSTFGFGEALVAVPLLALIMPVQVAAPVAALVSIVVAALVLAQDWAEVQGRSAWRLVLSTLVGAPLGLWALTHVDAAIVKATLGAVIMSFSLYSLRGGPPPALRDDRLAWAFGLGAGVLGGAYGMNGPPLVVYGALRGWSPGTFRATLQGYFLPASLVVMGGYWLVGLWTPAVTRYFVASLPAVLVAVVLGRVINRRLSRERFLRHVHVALVVIGAVLLGQAVV